MPRHILFIITKSNWGGAQRYVFDLAQQFSKKTNVTVAVGGNGELVEKLKKEKISVITIPSLSRDFSLDNDIVSFFKILHIIYRIKPDVLHVNSSKIGGLGALAGRIAGVPRIIFTAHGWAFNEKRSTLSKILISITYWLILLLSHRTIAVSYALQQQVASWPFVKKRIVVIHNGIASLTFLDRDKARDKLRLDKKAWIIGTIGELHPIKNQMALIQALDHPDLQSVHCVLCGDGQERKKLEDLIRRKKYKNRVHLLGHVKDAAQYLKAFDAFILPSFSEGLGYAILEAGQAHIPVIASNVGGIVEIISDQQTGLLINPHSIESIESAIALVYGRPDKAKIHADNLYKKVLEDFSLEKELLATEAIYQKTHSS